MLEIAVSAVILCNNLNWEHSPRCTAPVAEFHQTTTGFYGTLESGVEFTQTRITSSLQLFEAEQMKWLTDGKTVVYIDV